MPSARPARCWVCRGEEPRHRIPIGGGRTTASPPAAELVHLEVDLIVVGAPAALAAKNATQAFRSSSRRLPIQSRRAWWLASPARGERHGRSASSRRSIGNGSSCSRRPLRRVSRIAAILNMSIPSSEAWKEIERRRIPRFSTLQLSTSEIRRSGPAFDGAIGSAPKRLSWGSTLSPSQPASHRSSCSKASVAGVYASAECAGGLIVYGVNYPDRHVARRATRTDPQGRQAGGPARRAARRSSSWSSTSRPPRPSA